MTGDISMINDAKTTVLGLLTDLAPSSARADAATTLDRYATSDAVWNAFHPVNLQAGNLAAAENFWGPLTDALPDWEYRPGLAVAGQYEDGIWASTLGHIQGIFTRPWLGIPASNGLLRMRFGVNARVVDGTIERAYLHFDVVDVMRQAGHYPFRASPGSNQLWPDPPLDSGVDLSAHDGELGASTLSIIREMQEGLGVGDTVQDHARNAEHSSGWHPQMNWYGVAGIGSARGQRGFDDYHGAPFIEAFPDRGGFDHEPGGEPDAPGHYIQVGDGRFAATGGWPSLHGTRTGGSWLGLVPTRRPVTMRVADWYRTDADDLIVDNWVMIDVLDILAQEGHDVLAGMRYRTESVVPT